MDELPGELRLELVQTPGKELEGSPSKVPERDKTAVNDLDILRIDAIFVSVAPCAVPGTVLSVVEEPFIVMIEVSVIVRVLTIVRETASFDEDESVGLDRVIKMGELKVGDEAVSTLAEDSIELDRVIKIGVLTTGGELVSSLAEDLESEDPLVVMDDSMPLDKLSGSETVMVAPEVFGEVSPLLGLLEILEPEPHVVLQDIVDKVMRLGSGVPVKIWLSVLGDVKIRLVGDGEFGTPPLDPEMGFGVNVNAAVGSRDGLWGGLELFVRIHVVVLGCPGELLDGTGAVSVQDPLSEPVDTLTDGRTEEDDVKIMSVVPLTTRLLELNDGVDTRLGTIDGELRVSVESWNRDVVSGSVIGAPVVGQRVADSSVGLVVVLRRVEAVPDVIERPSAVESEELDSVSVPLVDSPVLGVLSEDGCAGVVGEVIGANTDVGDSRLAVILERFCEGLSGIPVDGVVYVGDGLKPVIIVGDDDPKIGVVEPFTASVIEMTVVRVVPSITIVVVNRAQFGGVRIPDPTEPDKTEVTVVLLVEMVSDANIPVAGEDGEAKGDDQTIEVELPDGVGQRVESKDELLKLWSVAVVFELWAEPVLGSGLGLDVSPEVMSVAAEDRHALLLIEIVLVNEEKPSTLVLDIRPSTDEDPAVLGVTENDESRGVPVSRPFVGVLALIEVLMELSIDVAVLIGSWFEVKSTGREEVSKGSWFDVCLSDALESV
ncbi:unnamed protein product [Clonostachys rosea]|uniref:Uncharacterized protein n=1 Tax=Bionectria ochroleuca TaxID=29856 RepID=A0ABY6UM19_BIOOC|nr:unnamed protein product [Clonostachys rosea]